MDSYKKSMSVLSAGNVLGIFAQGRRILPTEHDDGSIKAGVALFALRTGAAVVPVKITPRYRPFLPIVIKVGPPVNLDKFRDQKPRGEILQQAALVIYDKVKEM